MASGGRRLDTMELQTRALRKTVLTGRNLIDPIRVDVRAYVWRHGRNRTAEDFGVSRHTLWRFLERGHMGTPPRPAPF